MQLKEIAKIASSLMENRRVHLEREIGGAFYHGKRVARTIEILKNIIFPNTDFDMDILTVAAWFHDVGKGIEPHDKYGAAITKEALFDICKKDELDEICFLIANHKDKNVSLPDSVKLLQDADILDHFGTFTIWMDFLYSAHTEKTIKETADYNKNVWQDFHKSFRDNLNFDFSKNIYDEKIMFVNDFYERLRIEETGEIWGL